jgi:hypothetical protein
VPLAAIARGLSRSLADTSHRGSAYEALPPGGALVAIENMIDDARRENVGGLIGSLAMLIDSDGGFEFTGADFSRWCGEAGFQKVEILPLAGPVSTGVAVK